MTTAQLDSQLMQHLNERQKRLYAATKALQYGYGGIKKVHEALGISAPTIRRGIKDLQEAPLDRVRVPGGGRKKAVFHHPELAEVVTKSIRERGNPMKHLLYTHASIDTLTETVRKKGYHVGKTVINRLLWSLGFSLKGNKKALHQKSHKDRDKQFKYIDRLVDGFLKTFNIVLSIDAKKTEKVGNFANAGKTYQAKGENIKVEDHDFGKKDKQTKKIIKAIPFGIYDIKQNKGYVNVGTDHNTAEFAVESVRRWYHKEGRILYSQAKHIMMTADSGGANGNRVNQWKWELQQLANETGLSIHVCHYPAGTSKWNKIEHRLFSFISKNWQGIPLQTYEIILGLIEGTKTKTGLEVKAELDTGMYALKKRPTKEQMKTIRIKKHKFHPEWNYSIYPIN